MRAAIIGASGGIGRALSEALAARDDTTRLFALSRSGRVPKGSKIEPVDLDITDEQSIEAAASAVGSVDLVIVASGVLSDGARLQPEKSWRDQSFAAFGDVFAINTFGPAMVARSFLPRLPRKGRGVFAALSARVGSISDNDLGGWHAYRASKAALNMLLRNYALEYRRRNADGIIVGLHPGTVQTGLSAPFAGNVSHEVFTPQLAAEQLLRVIDDLSPSDSGQVFDWKGDVIPA